MVRLSFLGAAETVTGSKYLLEAGDAGVLVDCGLFQGLKELRLRNWDPLPVDVRSIDAAVLTHAHVDHVGYLPRLVKDGFSGPVYCTPATERIAELLLLDTARIQQDDAEYANRKGFSKHKPALPLYDVADARRALRRFRTVPRQEWFQAAGPIWMRYHDAGHLLGASMIEVEVRQGARPLRLLFSGDVGRYEAPLYFDPQPPLPCDYLICESTYGNRDHPAESIFDELAAVVSAAVARGGVMLVASFAVGRAQQLIYLLQILIEERRIPAMPIFLDSPMAVSGMNIYRYFAAEHDLSEALAVNPRYRFDLKHVRLSETVGQSKQINSERGPAVIISSSGMMTGGRILHHLRQRLPDSKTTVVLAGFQAEGTRGRSLEEGAKSLRIHGQDVPARAAVAKISALSGHAGRAELLRWLSALAAPRQAFITHGEKTSAEALADELRRARSWHAVVPKLGQSFELT